MNSDFYNDYEFYAYDYGPMDADKAEMMVGILGIVLVVGLIALVIGLVLYVLQSAGIYAIAKRRGIANAWLSWLPIGHTWLWGCICDDYQLKTKGQQKKLRWILLALLVANFLLSGAELSVGAERLPLYLDQMDRAELMTEAELLRSMGPSAGAAALSLLSGAVSLALTVVKFIALYHVYKSCDPANAVLYLVMSIIFGITRPFFIFFNRHKDLGLPSYRQPDRPEPWQQGHTYL